MVHPRAICDSSAFSSTLARRGGCQSHRAPRYGSPEDDLEHIRPRQPRHPVGDLRNQGGVQPLFGEKVRERLPASAMPIIVPRPTFPRRPRVLVDAISPPSPEILPIGAMRVSPIE